MLQRQLHEVNSMAISGITRLVQVTQITSRDASDGALPRGGQRTAAIVPPVKQFGSRSVVRANPRTYYEYTPDEQQRASVELQQKLAMMQPTLSPAASALLDLWVGWAAQHR